MLWHNLAALLGIPSSGTAAQTATRPYKMLCLLPGVKGERLIVSRRRSNLPSKNCAFSHPEVVVANIPKALDGLT